ncbi:MAG TPA: glucokinase [Candidatus Binataceae bacterium]|nr:glucokinase [Candidatus Binataceae bacterium]
MIIAADIGGTKTVLALYERTTEGLHQTAERVFASPEYDSLEAILREFLRDHAGVRLENACFGVPGAIIEGRVHTTNLTWNVTESALEAELKCRVKLLNDLQATAFGVRYLAPSELEVLNSGARPRHKGNIAVIAAGTGLGEAFLCFDGSHHHPMASEGGHSDFAPRNESQIELLRYLQKHFGNHISNERVLSGPGFYNIYCFLRDSGFAPEPQWLKDELAAGGDHSAIISEAGLAGKSALCEETLEMFAAIYGAEAGNMALRCMAVGGVFVAGGIAPKLIKVLTNGKFVEAFLNKGRMSAMLREIEVSVALNPHAPLIGAAHYALNMSM